MIFLHLLVMSYLVGFEVSEDQEMYKSILNGSIAENIEQYEDELKKADTLYFENENRKKVYKLGKKFPKFYVLDSRWSLSPHGRGRE